MTKEELIKAVAEKTGFPRNYTAEIMNALTEVILGTLATGKSVHLDRIGKLSVVARPERAGRNPRTGEALTLPASKTVKLSPS